jgi:hypothetical protein
MGTVVALDAETAIEQACEKFDITDSKYRRQLVASYEAQKRGIMGQAPHAQINAAINTPRLC